MSEGRPWLEGFLEEMPTSELGRPLELMCAAIRPPVTVGGKADAADVASARALAGRHGLVFLLRGAQPLEDLLCAHQALFVWAKNGLTLWSSKGPLRWTPGMAELRLKRLMAGARDDAFLRHAEFQAGESVLDCTLGFGQDALMAALAVGPSGRVVGVEKSFPLYVLAAEALRPSAGSVPSTHSKICFPVGGIEVIHGDASDFLKRQPPQSFDVVVLDPMFERPRKAQPQFEVLRAFAEYAPLSEEVLASARRVARRRVLVKSSRYSPTFKRLGLFPEPASRSSTVVWAKIQPNPDGVP